MEAANGCDEIFVMFTRAWRKPMESLNKISPREPAAKSRAQLRLR